MATNKKPTKTSVVKTNKKPATKPAVKKPTNKKGLIASIKAYEILDSRGFPTIEAFVTTKEGVTAKAMVPSGASTGEREALELRDGDKARYNGKGVLKAIKNVNTYIAKALVGKFSVLDQINIDQAMIALDQKLSKKPNSNFKTFLGANATLSVSMAVMRCAAQLSKKQLYAYIGENFNNNKTGKYVLPVPMLNVINGGAHADNTIDFQEFMYIPAGATSMHQAVQVSSECFHQLAKLLKKDGYNTSKGDEGGFAPLLKDAEQALTYMVKAITEAGYEPYNPNNKVTPKTVGISMDTACSELYDGKNYVFEKAVKANIKTLQQATFSTRQMIDYLELLSQKFPILSIEDGLSENDQNG
jgi:enolase